jgi:hypothetical protein
MQIAFSYPRRGLTGQFNTFRLGLSWVEKCPEGAQVELVDSRSKKLLKRAVVERVVTGELTDMAEHHSALAHNWREHPAEDRAALLIASMTRRYPPGRVHPHSMVSVIYLKEIPDASVSCDPA